MNTFVYRVATNLWIDNYRQQRPRPRMFSLDQVTHPDEGGATREFPGDTPQPHEQISDQEERASMRMALDRLTEPHRLVFELAVYQQRPYIEISELLGIPVGTVKSRMHNAVAAIKQAMAVTDSDADGKPIDQAGGA
jgi:RNA polymerase sigma-70 factor, ECF subfamily